MESLEGGIYGSVVAALFNVDALIFNHFCSRISSSGTGLIFLRHLCRQPGDEFYSLLGHWDINGR